MTIRFLRPTTLLRLWAGSRGKSHRHGIPRDAAGCHLERRGPAGYRGIPRHPGWDLAGCCGTSWKFALKVPREPSVESHEIVGNTMGLRAAPLPPQNRLHTNDKHFVPQTWVQRAMIGLDAAESRGFPRHPKWGLAVCRGMPRYPHGTSRDVAVSHT